MPNNSKYHYERKPKLTFYERGPGPAGYTLPPLVGKPKHGLTHRINPEYSIGLKLNSAFMRRNIGPGAAAYLIPQHLKANGYFAGFKYTCRQKMPLIDKRVVPPPNMYTLPNTNRYRHKAPTHYIGARTPLINKKVSPAPNTYILPPAIGPRIPDKLAAAECTLKGVRKPKDMYRSPGPIYDIGKPELVKPKGPAFTMRIRWKELQNLYNAGPASYTPLFPPPCPCKTPAKGWPLGVRYNDFTGVFRTQCDRSRYEPLD
ncbi:unnamed protein product [Orchesella dallaii]|uniref:Outer dense fiber protein 3 n=1 Tax=Orchesella dallaii TaxID=48710 RepID=A0ABP1PSK7_9HEXA